MTDFTRAQMRLIDANRAINVEYGDWWDSTYDQIVAACKAFGVDIATNTRTFDRKGPDGKFLRDENGKAVKGQHVEYKLYFSLYEQGAHAYFESDTSTVMELLTKGREVMTLPDDHDLAYLKTSEEPVVKVLRDNYEHLESVFGTYTLSGEMVDVLDNFWIQSSLGGRSSERMDIRLSFGGYIDDLTEAQSALFTLLTEEFTDDRAEWYNGAADGADGFLVELADAIHKELEAEDEWLTSDEAVWDTLVANDMTDEIEEEEEEEG